MIRSNTDCPYCHDIFDQYCNLFKGYKNCAKSDCEVLKILKENEQLKQQIEKMRICENCKHSYHDRYHNLRCIYNCFNFDKWELGE